MAMPDAIEALLTLAEAPRERLSRAAYNLTAFNPTAQEIHDVVRRAFPRAALGWKVDPKRQAIVDSWPENVDDGDARHDWGFRPAYDFRRAFDDYLIPTIRQRYQS
jgi:nucleoside-diphosphate-sugar epimerase